MGEQLKCEHCGKYFERQQGLSIHKKYKHEHGSGSGERGKKNLVDDWKDDVQD